LKLSQEEDLKKDVLGREVRSAKTATNPIPKENLPFGPCSPMVPTAYNDSDNSYKC
jgi:hypothetical protein